MLIPLVALLPVIVFLIVLKLLDSFSLVKWPLLILCIVYGVAVCGAILGLTLAVTLPEIAGASIVPLIEEVLKAIILVILVIRKKIRFLAEGLIYGAAVGGGFALLENVIYLINTDMNLGTAIFRGFSCATLHVGCTALVSTVAVIFKDRKPQAVFAVLSFIPSLVIHFLHNHLVENNEALNISPAVILVINVVFFTVLFVVLFSIGEKLIYKWMDHSISVDVQTLSSIKKGAFSTTKAGMYMLDVKEQFAPEVFFDMINFVELYLELKIEKQSQMLLSQAGFSEEEVVSEEYKAKALEFEGLKKYIGKTGLSVLGPLVQDGI